MNIDNGLKIKCQDKINRLGTQRLCRFEGFID